MIGGLIRPILQRFGLFTQQPRATPAIKRRGWVGAGYDAARTTSENSKHWANADAFGPRLAHNPAVRATLRRRSRYECQNNTYAQGLTLTLANDVIGTGPRLQMKTDDRDFNREVENGFHEWARAIDLAAKLRTMRLAQAIDGEAFAILANNPSVTPSLDLLLIEAEQVATPWNGAGLDETDGIHFDAAGNPTSYDVLRNHPGESGFLLDGMEADKVAAERMIHVFRKTRPGQIRGIPETTASLPLFAMLRRFSLAVVSAAEAVADVGAGVIYSDQAPNTGEDAEPYEEFELERNMLTILPDGWKMQQLKPEQPTSTYADFKREVLSECSRQWSMPFNITACNSSGYNYASGRLDHQTYYKQIAIERAVYECCVCDRILAEWLAEARLLADFTRIAARLERKAPYRAFQERDVARVVQVPRIPHAWMWDGSAHVDPSKEATAQATRLASFTTTLEDEYGREGKDWEQQLRQIAKEMALREELKLPMPVAPGQAAPAEDDDDSPPRKSDAA